MNELTGLSREEVERRALLWTKLAQMLMLPVGSESPESAAPATEAERQRNLYADLLAKLPPYNGSAFKVELRHPDLSLLSHAAMSLRTSSIPRLMYGIAPADEINWYGNLVRPEGGNGMYATPAQAEVWPNKSDSRGVTIGPK